MFILSHLNDHSIASFVSRCSEDSISMHHALCMKPWISLRLIGRIACGIVALHRHKQESHKGRQESRDGGTPPCRDFFWASGEASLTAPDECTMSPVYENTIRTQSVYESIPWKRNVGIRDQVRLTVSGVFHKQAWSQPFISLCSISSIDIYRNSILPPTVTNVKLEPTLRSRALAPYSSHDTHLQTTLIHHLQALQALRLGHFLHQ